jgi:hypothetical protein
VVINQCNSINWPLLDHRSIPYGSEVKILALLSSLFEFVVQGSIKYRELCASVLAIVWQRAENQPEYPSHPNILPTRSSYLSKTLLQRTWLAWMYLRELVERIWK